MIPNTKVDEVIAEFQTKRQILGTSKKRTPSQSEAGASTSAGEASTLATAVSTGVSTSSIQAPPSVSIRQQTYRVQKGDSAWSIARDFGITVNELVKVNNLKSAASIRVDQELQIP